VRERNGLVSHILLQRGDLPEAGITATWVEGGRVGMHHHPSEQVYVTTAGRGRSWWGREREVGGGDLVYVPSGVVRGIGNVLEAMLTDVSATPTLGAAEAAYDTGQPRPEGRTQCSG